MDILFEMEDTQDEYDMKHHPYLDRYNQIFEAKL